MPASFEFYYSTKQQHLVVSTPKLDKLYPFRANYDIKTVVF